MYLHSSFFLFISTFKMKNSNNLVFVIVFLLFEFGKMVSKFEMVDFDLYD